MNTPTWTLIIAIDLLSIAALCIGLLLYLKLVVHRHTFLSALKIEGQLEKPSMFGGPGWLYGCMTLFILFLSLLPLLRD